MQMIDEEPVTMHSSSSDPALYAVFGQPIDHSLSPRIHAAFARDLSIALNYRAIEASAEDFIGALAGFADQGGRGANVTLPLKQVAARLCLTVSERAHGVGDHLVLGRELKVHQCCFCRSECCGKRMTLPTWGGTVRPAWAS